MRHQSIFSRMIRDERGSFSVEAILMFPLLVWAFVPIMADAAIATAIVVETWTTYDPIMDIGLTDTEIHNLVVTAPRFTDQLVFAGLGDGTGTEHDDGTGDSEGL